VEKCGKEIRVDGVSRYDDVCSQLRFLFSFGTFRFRTLTLNLLAPTTVGARINP